MTANTLVSSTIVSSSTDRLRQRQKDYARWLNHWFNGGCLYRYLPRCYAEETQRTGRYFMRASTGASDLPADAQRDNEHHKSVLLLGSIEGFVQIETSDSADSRISERSQGTEISSELRHSFLYSSFSLELRDAVFDEFSSEGNLVDSVLVIKDIPEFMRRLHNALRRRGLNVMSRPVNYASELIAFGRVGLAVNPMFDKDAKYESQKEFRTAAWPLPEGMLASYLPLGSLSDIAEVLCRHQIAQEVTVPDEFFREMSRGL